MVDKEQMIVLLTGATGFIGSHAARFLAGDGSGRKVVALVRRGAGKEKLNALEQSGVILARGDFTDRNEVRELFRRHSPRQVVHLAALRGSGRGSTADYHRVNVEGTKILLEESAGHDVETFIFCSSVGVTGTIPRKLPGTTSTPFHGDSAYHKSKIRGEEAVDRSIRQGLNAYIVRPTITYGPGDMGFPSTLVDLVRRQRFPLPRTEVRIHLLDVAALCRLFCLLLDHGSIGPRIIIAADRAPVSLAGLVNEIHRRIHGRDYPRFPFLPRGTARLLSWFLGIVGSDTWRTRVRLISESWYYRTDATATGSDYVPSDTLSVFPESMCR